MSRGQPVVLEHETFLGEERIKNLSGVLGEAWDSSQWNNPKGKSSFNGKCH